MPIPVGGHRARCIIDSVFNQINDALGALGWFDSGRQHQPVEFRTKPIDEGEVPLNVVVLVPEDIDDEEVEMGSMLSEFSRVFFIDIYGEDLSVSESLAFDLRDILQGRMPSIGRDEPLFQIFDYAQATPPVFAIVDVENVQIDRSHSIAYEWQKFWYSVSFVIVDYYENENG